MSDNSIAARFDEIYNATSKAALALITARCGRTADIGDIFQETYMELYRLLQRRGTGYVTHENALVLRIAKRKIAKHHSLLARLKMFVSAIKVGEDSDTIEITDFEADSFCTEEFTINSLLLDEAMQNLMSKPESVRKAFYLMYDVGLTIPEIAKAMSISESNVKNKLYRTLKELREIIK